MTNPDHRAAAQEHVRSLISMLNATPQRAALHPLIDEFESLERAIGAFHLEAIRFRMFNVDRLLAKGNLTVPDGVPPLFQEARRELEAAGFHTRSHQAPS